MALILAIAALAGADRAQAPDTQVKTANGILAGTLDPDGIRSFKGVPYAAPPVGDLRWREPQPVTSWEGVRKADAFGPRAMQPPIFGDMVFRSNGMSEDCLYLNVWTPAKSGKERLPVLVYFYGGGFVAGDGSEPRYDGESMAHKGIVAVTVNYRLGIFGFFTHPELTRESPHHASGNYGLLDQSAALQWVHRNIAAFGGDPKRVTIAGESAGSFSVSLQMASPLSKHLIAGAIGESGASFGATLGSIPRERAEANGEAFGKEVGAPTVSALRAIPAEKLLDLTKTMPFRFSLSVDGYFLPHPAVEIYTAGEQAHVPLLAGWNAEESGAGGVLGQRSATPDNFAQAIHALYPAHADEALRVYHATDDASAKQVAIDLASDRFIGYGTWKWIDLQAKTGGKPVYRYRYAHPRPGQEGAYHSSEIEYALGNLDGNKVYSWTDDDRKVSTTLQEYFANFIKHGDPNGPGLPEWPAFIPESGKIMLLDVNSHVIPDETRERYLFLDSLK
jgi:para-nitrobenzyl esterase